MIINSPRTLLRMLGDLWSIMVPIAIYMGLISWLDILYHYEEYNLPVSIIAIPGTVIGLLLAFRTNSCYCRWWEARIIWGAIVNDSRTWVRQLLEFSDTGKEPAVADPHLRAMAYRQSAWCYTLARSLRKQSPLVDVEHLIEEPERDQLEKHDNVPNAILLNQAEGLRAFHDENKLNTYQFVELERTLLRLTDSMGGCERIKNTTFPTSYSYLVSIFIYLFIILLPFGLAAMPPLGLFATALSLAFTFLIIDRVADYLQDPFEDRPSDTPMLGLSRTIEINIRQMLGETEVPERSTPSNGIIY